MIPTRLTSSRAHLVMVRSWAENDSLEMFQLPFRMRLNVQTMARRHVKTEL